MNRTQIYLPADLHAEAKRIAKSQNISLAELSRIALEEKIDQIKLDVKKQRKAFAFFANPPGKYQLDLSGKDAVELVRKDRDGEY